MSKNYVITIARGFGSGGKTIGQMLAGELGIEYYDRDILRMASEESGIYEGLFGMLEEKGKRRRLFRKDGEYRHEKPNTRPESSEFVSDDNLFKFQAQIIKGLAEREENCIMVGRCADYVLEGRENLVRLFIYADRETCIKNVMEMYAWSRKDAERIIEKTDKNRKTYYRYYTGRDWEDASNYDLCINTSQLGYERSVRVVRDYLRTLGLEK